MKKERTLRQILLSALGKAWMQWPPRNAVKKRCKDPKRTGWYLCELCKESREKIDIDHIIPCIKPSEGWISWDAYITSRFVEDEKKLQGICKDCHKAKSKAENAERKAKRKVTSEDLDEFSKRFKGTKGTK
jgi:5-methylcytosine-specific restriction endonuclease McrA